MSLQICRVEVFVEFVCVLSVYGIRVILRGDLTVDKCLNWILRGVGEMEGFQVIFGVKMVM